MTPATSPPGANGGGGLELVLALHHEEIRKVHAACPHRDHNLTR